MVGINGIARASVDFVYGTTTIHDACATRDLEFDDKTIPAVQVHDAAMAALAFAYGKVMGTDSYLAASSGAHGHSLRAAI